MIEGTVFHTPVSAGATQVIEPTGRCPECAGRLVHRDGCAICVACGFSRCG